jgi:O-antigen/teichoic acid export membrane protein
VRSEYARNVATLSSGLIAAQAITVLSTPVLARLFGAGEIGEFALFTAIANLLIGAATARYELAINLQESDDAARRLVRLCAMLALALTAVVSGATLLLVAWGVVPQLYLLLGIAVLPAALYNPLNYWCTRRREYRLLSASRVLRAILAAVGSIGLGLARAGSVGLVLGSVLGQVGATALLGRSARRRDGQQGERFGAGLAETARRYRDFPVFSTPAFLTKTVAEQAPVLMLAAIYDPVTVGYFALTQRLVRMPLIMVGTAVGDIYRQRVSEERLRHGSVHAVYRRTLFHLALVSGGPFLALLLLAPAGFELLLGETWRVAGHYAQVMAGMYFLQFLALPLAATFAVAERQGQEMLTQLVILALAVAGFISAHVLFGNPLAAVSGMAAGFAAGYVVSLATTARLAAATGTTTAAGWAR